ncbi:hypothetical protein J6590_017858 [Homalodisca vitripennis]|nr:hypothetical protein J6590_017858 [Homalodisca vitripennis]
MCSSQQRLFCGSQVQNGMHGGVLAMSSQNRETIALWPSCQANLNLWSPVLGQEVLATMSTMYDFARITLSTFKDFTRYYYFRSTETGGTARLPHPTSQFRYQTLPSAMHASLIEASFVLSSPYHSSGPTPSTGNAVTPELQFNTIGTSYSSS